MDIIDRRVRVQCPPHSSSYSVGIMDKLLIPYWYSTRQHTYPPIPPLSPVPFIRPWNRMIENTPNASQLDPPVNSEISYLLAAVTKSRSSSSTRNHQLDLGFTFSAGPPDGGREGGRGFRFIGGGGPSIHFPVSCPYRKFRCCTL